METEFLKKFTKLNIKSLNISKNSLKSSLKKNTPTGHKIISEFKKNK